MNINELLLIITSCRAVKDASCMSGKQKKLKFPAMNPELSAKMIIFKLQSCSFIRRKKILLLSAVIRRRPGIMKDPRGKFWVILELVDSSFDKITADKKEVNS